VAVRNLHTPALHCFFCFTCVERALLGQADAASSDEVVTDVIPDDVDGSSGNQQPDRLRLLRSLSVCFHSRALFIALSSRPDESDEESDSGSEPPIDGRWRQESSGEAICPSPKDAYQLACRGTARFQPVRFHKLCYAQRMRQPKKQ